MLPEPQATVAPDEEGGSELEAVSRESGPGAGARCPGGHHQGHTVSPSASSQATKNFSFFKANLVTVYCVHHGVALTQRVQFHTV